jgi:hypothetical protein
MRHETVKRADHAAHDPGLPPAPLAGDQPAPAVSLLALQFLAWVAAAPRTRADVMDAWRSTCPRQSVWEDTVIDGLVAFADDTHVMLTARGRAVLDAGTGAGRR